MCRGAIGDNVVNVDCGLVRESLESSGASLVAQMVKNLPAI